MDKIWVRRLSSAGGRFLKTFAYAIAVVAIDRYLIIQRASARIPKVSNLLQVQLRVVVLGELVIFTYRASVRTIAITRHS